MQEKIAPSNGEYFQHKEDVHTGNANNCVLQLRSDCHLMDLYRKRSLLINGSATDVSANGEDICAIHDKIADGAAHGLADVIAKAKLLNEFIAEAGAPRSLEARLVQTLLRELEHMMLTQRDSCQSPRR